ncbi:MAG: hypothetical protein GX382_04210 [Syntrophomonadaceae bacterium]|nr:hypothetical protein [Syntrophomonadaceae bacterium]
MERFKPLIVTSDASGAQEAARQGFLVMIVDVIDMSTTLESALEAGAIAVLGASPDETRAPVRVDPEGMGRYAAQLAHENRAGIILVSEPRVGTDQDRLQRCNKVMQGISQAGGTVEAVLPNLGAETPRMLDMSGKVVVAVTDTGGVAYDAAFLESPRVITGTVARTYQHRGIEPARRAVERARQEWGDARGLAIVAASRNSMEDVLAAQFIANLMLK